MDCSEKPRRADSPAQLCFRNIMIFHLNVNFFRLAENIWQTDLGRLLMLSVHIAHVLYVFHGTVIAGHPSLAAGQPHRECETGLFLALHYSQYSRSATSQHLTVQQSGVGAQYGLPVGCSHISCKFHGLDVWAITWVLPLSVFMNLNQAYVSFSVNYSPPNTMVFNPRALLLSFNNRIDACGIQNCNISLQDSSSSMPRASLVAENCETTFFTLCIFWCYREVH